MYTMANQLYEQGQSGRALLNILGMMLDLMEREAKLLGLDAATRNRMERPDHSRVQPERTQVEPTIWSLLAQAEPTDVETIKRIQELDPIEKPERYRRS